MSSEDPVEDDWAVALSPAYYISGSDCGYCGDKKTTLFLGLENLPIEANAPTKCTHITVGTMVDQMSCSRYGKLIDQGFRRLGCFVYKGDMLRGCCRMYTIRTDISRLKITKEHRHAVNRFGRAIADRPKETGQRNASFDLSLLIHAEQASSRFHTRYEPSKATREKLELYQKYQTTVHNDDPEEVTLDQFNLFLCHTPFPNAEVYGEDDDEWDYLNSWVQDWEPENRYKTEGIDELGKPYKKPPRRIGPTHECYYLDGKLIAFSVLDFLPVGLSSVYFVWDPDYAHLSLGTILALREIQMCDELGLGPYYLGYYLPECQKMKYKGKFGGEVLDVCTGRYIPLDEAKSMIKNGQFFLPSEKAELSDAEIAEPELHLDKEPTSWAGHFFDVCDQVYGRSSVYEEAEKAAEIVKKTLNISKLSLPAVFPGAVPMTTVQKWVEDGLLGPKITINNFGDERRQFDKLNPAQRGAVVDLARLLGIHLLDKHLYICI